ncbi:MAG: LysM peptidoglycan-binding domain-containing protein [Magnetococcus sp. WYHC-3]
MSSVVPGMTLALALAMTLVAALGGTPAPAMAGESLPTLHQRKAQGDVLAPLPGSAWTEPYRVQPGDTLWDLSRRFLGTPLRWPEVHGVNPAIADPHWIYPGDRLQAWSGAVVVIPAGLPTWQATAGARLGPPRSWKSLLEQRFMGPLAAARATAPWIVEALPSTLGQVLAGLSGRLALATGDDVLLTPGTHWILGQRVVLGREGEVLLDPGDGLPRGRLLHLLGEAVVRRVVPQGAVAEILSAGRDIAPGDLVLTPRPLPPVTALVEQPVQPVDARVLNLLEDVTAAGAGQSVVLGAGRRERLLPGLVLSILEVPPAVAHPGQGEPVPLPPRAVATAVVYSVGERASLALLVECTRPVHRGDWVVGR